MNASALKLLTCLSLIVAISAPSLAAAESGDLLRFPIGVKKQSDLFQTFAALKLFVRNIPRDVQSCFYSLRSKTETARLLEADKNLRAKMRAIFDERINAPTSQNCLSFTNSDADFSKITNTDLGVCAGVTFTAWLTNYLAVWDPAGTAFSSYKTQPTLTKGWTNPRIADSIARWRAKPASYNAKDGKAIAEFYAPFLDNLYLKKEVTVIPYFSNLEEFSKHPAIRERVKRVALDEWARTNVSVSSILEMGLSARPFLNTLKKNEIRSLALQIENYLDSGIGPIVFFSLPSPVGGTQTIHVVRVKKIARTRDGDTITIHVVDPNYFAPANIANIKVSGLKKLHDSDPVKAVYSNYVDDQVNPTTGAIDTPLAELEIVPWFDVETVNMLGAWKKFLADSK